VADMHIQTIQNLAEGLPADSQKRNRYRLTVFCSHFIRYFID